MTNKERLEANNAKIEQIQEILQNKQVSPTDRLQARVDETNDASYLFYRYGGTNPNIVKGLDTSNVTSMVQMFSNCSKLINLDMSTLDTSNVTSMSEMFYNCINLTNLDLSNFNTSNVTGMTGMFSSCYNLTNITFGNNFNTSNIKIMYNMFGSCKKLTSLDLSNFNTSNVTDMNNMFYACQELTSLNLSNWNTSNVTGMGSMFQNCYKLQSLDLSHFDMTKVGGTGSMFNYCNSLKNVILPSTIKIISAYFFASCSKLTEFTILATEPPTLANTTNCISGATTSIYVPDASVDAYKTATNWSAYADKIKPLSSKGA